MVPDSTHKIMQLPFQIVFMARVIENHKNDAVHSVTYKD